MVHYRIKLCLETDLNVRPEWAYRLYAALLAMGTEQFGDMVHRDGITPISQHLERDGDGVSAYLGSRLPTRSVKFWSSTTGFT